MAFIAGTAVATGDVLAASRWNQDVVANVAYVPRGILYQSGSITSGFVTNAGTGHGTYQTRTSMSGSVTYDANRYMRVVAVMRLYCSGGANGIKVQFRRGTTVIAQNSIDSVNLSTTAISTVVFDWVFQGPATGATETFDVQMAAGINVTAVNDGASATYPSLFYVQDMGSAV